LLQREIPDEGRPQAIILLEAQRVRIHLQRLLLEI
jgi:hypothetical protein